MTDRVAILLYLFITGCSHSSPDSQSSTPVNLRELIGKTVTLEGDVPPLSPVKGSLETFRLVSGETIVINPAPLKSLAGHRIRVRGLLWWNDSVEVTEADLASIPLRVSVIDGKYIVGGGYTLTDAAVERDLGRTP